jgi:hypothetical protein
MYLTANKQIGDSPHFIPKDLSAPFRINLCQCVAGSEGLGQWRNLEILLWTVGEPSGF